MWLRNVKYSQILADYNQTYSISVLISCVWLNHNKRRIIVYVHSVPDRSVSIFDPKTRQIIEKRRKSSNRRNCNSFIRKCCSIQCIISNSELTYISIVIVIVLATSHWIWYEKRRYDHKKHDPFVKHLDVELKPETLAETIESGPVAY